MARTRVKLRWPYRLQTTLDLGELVLVARYDASREKACTASLPQAPYDSATRGIHVHSYMVISVVQNSFTYLHNDAYDKQYCTIVLIMRWVVQNSIAMIASTFLHGYKCCANISYHLHNDCL